MTINVLDQNCYGLGFSYLFSTQEKNVAIANAGDLVQVKYKHATVHIQRGNI